MNSLNNFQKYYRGKLTLLDSAEEQLVDYKDLLKKEKRLMEIHSFGDDYSDSDSFRILDNVNTLKNLMVFAEINRYKNTLLSDMDKEERNEITQLIIDNLDRFEIKPVGYEVKQDSIVIAWYLNSVINTFTFMDQITAVS